MTTFYSSFRIPIPGISPGFVFQWPKADVFIFDIDGCIADDSWRLDLIEGAADGDEHAKFEAYHALIPKDIPIAKNQKILRELLDKEVIVVFATARPERYRPETSAWMQDNFGTAGCPAFVHLLMRDDEDRRGSVAIKSDMLAQIRAATKGVIKNAYDDRKDIVRMYLEQGINAWVLDKGPMRRPGDETIKASDYVNIVSKTVASSPEMQRIVKAAKGDPTVSITSKVGDIERIVTATGKSFPEVEAAAQRLDAAIAQYGDHEIDFDEPTSPPMGNAAEESQAPRTTNARDCLQEAMATYDERRARYGAVEGKSAQILDLLFPEGITLESFDDFAKFQMVVHVVGKLGRYTGSGMSHRDSVHDLITYCALLDSATVNAERGKE